MRRLKREKDQAVSAEDFEKAQDSRTGSRSSQDRLEEAPREDGGPWPR